MAIWLLGLRDEPKRKLRLRLHFLRATLVTLSRSWGIETLQALTIGVLVNIHGLMCGLIEILLRLVIVIASAASVTCVWRVVLSAIRTCK